ncbi:MAG: PHP domain-containing protein [Candidatus Absconditabacterales bacterium]
MHSLNYSDGMNTLDEIVQYAGKIGLKKITITDHSQFEQNACGSAMRNRRLHINRWKNIHNDVEVNFGVEGDLIDEEGNCSFDIQGHEGTFCILSCHAESFNGDLKNITQAYINAIHKHHDKIKFMGHICNLMTSKYLDIEAIAKVLNQYLIPIEINCYYLHIGKTNLEKLDKLLSLIEGGVYVNSDMHTLNDFSFRQEGFDYIDRYLKQKKHTS